MNDETSFAWFCGLFEGEGSASLREGSRGAAYPALQVGMTDVDVIKRVAEVTGVGHVGGPYNRNDNWKPFWTWQLTKTNEVLELIDQMLPYMGERRSARLIELRDGARFASKPTSEERFWGLIDKTDDHWLWTGHIDKYGFGTWTGGADGTRKQAHRAARIVMGLELPPRMENLCGVKHCARPDHWRSAARDES